MIAALLLLLCAALASPPMVDAMSPDGRIADTLSCALTGSDDCEGEWVAVGPYTHTSMRAVCAATCDAFLQFSIDAGATVIGGGDGVKVASDAIVPFHALEAYGTHVRLVIRDTSGGANQADGVLWLRSGGPGPQTRSDATLSRYSNATAMVPVADFDSMVSRGRLEGFSTVHKFGRNPDCGATAEFVDTLSTTASSFITAASAIRIRSGGSADDDSTGTGAQAVFCEGVDGSFDAVSTTLTTAGASASSASSETFLRINRCYVTAAGTYTAAANGGSNAGDIIIETTGGTALAQIDTGRGQTSKASYTVPNGFTAYILTLNICSEAAKGADLWLYQRRNSDDVTGPTYTAPRLIQQFPGVGQCVHVTHRTLESYPAKTDLWFTCLTVAGANADVVAEMELLLEADD